MLVTTDHAIDRFNFALWRGDPPRLVEQHVRSHTKPGAHGVGQQKLGVWGQPFETELTAFFPDKQTALVRMSQYHRIIADGAKQVKYENVNMLGTYRHVYLVDMVEILQLRAVLNVIAQNFDYPQGFRLVSRWRLTPHRLPPDED